MRWLVFFLPVGGCSSFLVTGVLPSCYNKKELWKPQWAEAHFWLATIGIVLYTVAMWAAGLMEGLQWRALNDAGQLANPIFLDITARLQPFLLLRALGGAMYLVGAIMMAINFWKTVRSPEGRPDTVPATV